MATEVMAAGVSAIGVIRGVLIDFSIYYVIFFGKKRGGSFI